MYPLLQTLLTLALATAALGTALAPTHAPGPTAPSCYNDAVRCAGAPNKPYYPYAPCCNPSASCTAAPDLGYGRFCVVPSPPQTPPPPTRPPPTLPPTPAPTTLPPTPAPPTHPACISAYGTCGSSAPCCAHNDIPMICSHNPIDDNAAACVPLVTSSRTCIRPYSPCGQWMTVPCCGKSSCSHAPWNRHESVCVPTDPARGAQNCAAPYKKCDSHKPCCGVDGIEWSCGHAFWNSAEDVCMPVRLQK